MHPDEPLLRVEGLRIEAAGNVVIDDVSFDIGRGEFVAIVGESGSGKTMVARSILGLLPRPMKLAAGRIHFDGRELSRLSPTAMRAVRGREIGMVFQEPLVSLNPALRIGDQLGEGLRCHTDANEGDIERRCIEMLERVRIADPVRCLAAYPHEFSGGMRQRIVLAAVMLLRPRLLIADEPTTALDTLSQREVLDLIGELRREFAVTVMLITHNLGLVFRYADRAIVLERGKLVESGDAQRLLSAPSHAYTQKLVASLPRRQHAQQDVSTSEVLLSVRSLEVRFAGRARLLGRAPAVAAIRGIDLDIHRGETVAVVGESGSGKSTLGRALLGLVPRSAGSIEFRGADPFAGDKARRRAFRLASQLVFQDPYSSLDPLMRVRDVVAEPLRHAAGLTRGERDRRVSRMLEEVALAGFERRFAHELSGGQRQRVAIARAIISRPLFVVADEAVSALDMTIQMQVLKLFQHLQKSLGFACLFISHDFAVVELIADRVVVMQRGQIVEANGRDEVFDRPQHPYTRALLEATPGVPESAASSSASA